MAEAATITERFGWVDPFALTPAQWNALLTEAARREVSYG